MPEATTIEPDRFYRKSVAGKFFGYRPTQLEEKIRAGKIPPPVHPDPDGRMAGWFGRTILAWQADREAAASKTRAA